MLPSDPVRVNTELGVSASIRLGRPGRTGICPLALMPPRLNPVMGAGRCVKCKIKGYPMNRVIRDTVRRKRAHAFIQPLAEKRVKLKLPRGSGLWSASSGSGSLSHIYCGTVVVVNGTGAGRFSGGGAYFSDGVALNRGFIRPAASAACCG